jgi:hypothetical protein
MIETNAEERCHTDLYRKQLPLHLHDGPEEGGLRLTSRSLLEVCDFKYFDTAQLLRAPTPLIFLLVLLCCFTVLFSSGHLSIIRRNCTICLDTTDLHKNVSCYPPGEWRLKKEAQGAYYVVFRCLSSDVHRPNSEFPLPRLYQ